MDYLKKRAQSEAEAHFALGLIGLRTAAPEEPEGSVDESQAFLIAWVVGSARRRDEDLLR